MNAWCLNCNTQQDWEQSHWSIGPSSRRVSFTCPTCGWLVEVKAQTVEHMIANMPGEADEFGSSGGPDD